MKILIIGHAYLDSEIRKNAHALSQHVELQVVCPSSGRVLVHQGVGFEGTIEDRRIFQTFGTLDFGLRGYVLKSLTFGLQHYRPDLILVEYNPWSPVFVQALLFRFLYCRNARIGCAIKQNTYTRYSGLFGLLKNAVVRFLLRRTDFILAESERAQQLLVSELGYPASQIIVLTMHGVDTDKFNASPRPPERQGDALTIGYVGWMAQRKGVITLIEAAKKVHARRPDAIRLRLVGNGDLLEPLQKQTVPHPWMRISAGISNTQVPGFLNELDAFVMPSPVLPHHEEHDGRAIVEAMSCGLPVIGTRSGIIPELLKDECGILVDAGSPEQICDEIIRLLDDAKLRARLSRKGRERVLADFSLQSVAAKRAVALRRFAENPSSGDSPKYAH